MRLDSSSNQRTSEVESNGSHKGTNVIGATELLREFKFYYSTYESKRGAEKGLKSVHVRKFIDKLMRLKEGQEVWIILDNSGAQKKVARECGFEYGSYLCLQHTRYGQKAGGSQ